MIRATQVLRSKISVMPPNIGSLKELGKFTSSNPAAHPELFARLKSLYVNLPKGPAPKVTPTRFGEWYYQKYVETNSPMPLVHFLVITMCFGYYSIAHIHDVTFYLHSLTYSTFILHVNSIRLNKSWSNNKWDPPHQIVLL